MTGAPLNTAAYDICCVSVTPDELCPSYSFIQTFLPLLFSLSFTSQHSGSYQVLRENANSCDSIDKMVQNDDTFRRTSPPSHAWGWPGTRSRSVTSPLFRASSRQKAGVARFCFLLRNMTKCRPKCRGVEFRRKRHSSLTELDLNRWSQRATGFAGNVSMERNEFSSGGRLSSSYFDDALPVSWKKSHPGYQLWPLGSNKLY